MNRMMSVCCLEKMEVDDIQQTATDKPIAAPVVNLQPLIPAKASGGPMRKQKQIHNKAGGEKFLPAPSDAGDWATGCWVEGWNNSGYPDALLIIGADRGRRLKVRKIGEACVGTRQQRRKSERSNKGIMGCRQVTAIAKDEEWVPGDLHTPEDRQPGERTAE